MSALRSRLYENEMKQKLQSIQEQHRTIVTPTQRDYNIQKIDGLEPNMVTPPKEVIKRIKADSDAVRQARARISPVGDFTDGFDWSISGPISSVLATSAFLTASHGPHITVSISPHQKERLF